MLVGEFLPAPVGLRHEELPGGADEPRRRNQQADADTPQHRPGEQALARGQEDIPDKVVRQKGLRDLTERQHEGAHSGVVLDLEAEVGVRVHLGEEVGVRALREQPVLCLQLGSHGLVGLVKQAQPVDAADAHDDHAEDRDQRQHKLPYHTSGIMWGGDGSALYGARGKCAEHSRARYITLPGRPLARSSSR
jgi:hypothetical protein